MKRMMKNRSGRRGFSLVEVMIAIIILSVALLALAQLMALATRTNALAGRTTSAASIARAQLERLKSATFYTDYSNPDVPVINGILVNGGDLEGNANGYFQFYDPDGLPVPAGAPALYVARWQIEDLVNPNAVGGLPLAMKKITVRCLPAAEVGSMFQRIGDAVLVTYRTANVG